MLCRKRRSLGTQIKTSFRTSQTSTPPPRRCRNDDRNNNVCNSVWCPVQSTRTTFPIKYRKTSVHDGEQPSVVAPRGVERSLSAAGKAFDTYQQCDTLSFDFLVVRQVSSRSYAYRALCVAQCGDSIVKTHFLFF